MVLVVVKDDRLELRAPFHPGLSYRCRALGGRWKGVEVGWVFELEKEDALRALCLELFALDGREESLQDTVDLEVTVDERTVVRSVFEGYGRSIAFLGREIIVPLPNRDLARPGRGVKFLKGRPFARRSHEDWHLSVPNGSVFVMRAVPRVTLDRLRASIGDAGSVQVM